MELIRVIDRTSVRILLVTVTSSSFEQHKIMVILGTFCHSTLMLMAAKLVTTSGLQRKLERYSVTRLGIHDLMRGEFDDVPA